jgi:hypothetical protein
MEVMSNKKTKKLICFVAVSDETAVRTYLNVKGVLSIVQSPRQFRFIQRRNYAPQGRR